MTALDITVPVPPGEVAVNRRYCKSGVLARRWRAGRDEIVMHLRQAWRKEPIAGPVRVELHAHWPTAAGDVDSPVKAVLDALQHAGVVVNDRQIIDLHVTRSKGGRGSMQIVVERLRD